jgi:hypothetical protein
MTPSRLMTRSVLLATLGVTASWAGPPIAANPPKEVVLTWGEACDSQNGRLYIENRHTFRTAIATVHWKAAGGKELEAVFVIEPTLMQEIGCAVPGAVIVKAELGDF